MNQKMNTVKWNKKFLAIVSGVVVIFIILYSFNRKSRHHRLGLGENGVEVTRSNNFKLAEPSLAKKNDLRTFELKSDSFYINGERTRIHSGAVHYFRVVPEYWLDRLIRLKSAGLNTVETYVPWNRHEEIRGHFNFEGILNIRRFLALAHDLGLYVILRPGPYICSEWEFGGLPSWLLRDEHMQVRSTYEPFLIAVDRYFKALFKQVEDLQFHYSGPIIMMQIENEYGSFGSDIQYMLRLKEIMKNHGIVEELFVSENMGGLKKMNLPGVLKTANFKKVSGAKTAFRYLKATQANKPLMVMEFWSGWFDEWGGRHNTFSAEEFRESLEFILSEGSSVNIYLFHGGTNFGFMNGRNGYSPDVTSYDYDAPLTEAGDITTKYHVIRDLIVKHKLNNTEFRESLEFILSEGSSVNIYLFHGGTNFGFMNGRNGYSPDVTSYDYDAPLTEAGDITTKYHVIRDLIVKHKLNNTALPDVPLNTAKAGYGVLKVHRVLHWDDLLSLVQALPALHLVTMERLDHNNGSGQGYGFIVYRHSIPRSRYLKIKGHMNDRAQILINGVEIQTLDHLSETQTITLKYDSLKEHNVLDIMVENTGRITWGKGNVFNEQRKGLDGVIMVDDTELRSWKIYPLELKDKYFQRLSTSDAWATYDMKATAPALYEVILNIDTMPKDTFLDMKGWHKGVVFVNGFNIGRYWHIGPTRTLYVPAPLLRNGQNKITVFELHTPLDHIVSTDGPILG